jgi:prepilin-type N-terminal cleavage/methylation domain-containing protein
MKRAHRHDAGFTIVETLIVLAVAGLIALIVFEALPALTRNSRNSQRRQDAAAILNAVGHYMFNNSDNFPAGCGSGYGSNCATASNTSLFFYTRLHYYDPTTNVVTVHPQVAGSNLPAATSADKVDVYDYELCSTTTQGAATATGADYTNVVAMFGIETGSGVQGMCEQL